MQKFLRYLLFPLSFIRFVLLWLISVFFMFTVIIENIIYKRTGRYGFWSSRNWGKISLFILGFRIRQNEFPKAENYLLMPNHRSYIDIMIVASCSSSVFVAKTEVKKWPVLGQALKASQTVIVNRNEIKSLMNTMHQIKKTIEKGISITVFPEGTTFEGPGIKPFKNGTFKIAADQAIPIIPCAIEYHDKKMAWVGNDAFVTHFFRQMWHPISRAEIRFGQPLVLSDYQELKSETEQKIIQLLIEIKRK